LGDRFRRIAGTRPTSIAEGETVAKPITASPSAANIGRPDMMPELILTSEPLKQAVEIDVAGPESRAIVLRA